MAGVNRTTGKATDLITFSRASGGTALRKISYGSELVTNGTFDSNTGWTKGTGWSISDGTAIGSAASSNLQQPIPVTLGKVYFVSFEVVSRVAGSIGRVQIGSQPGPTLNASLAGTYTSVITAPASGAQQLYVVANGFTGAIDNVSVKEVLFDQPDGTLTLFNHPTNIPRIEYAADGTVKGLLIEEQRVNLVTYSEDFTNAAWTKGSTATLAIDATGPDGKTSAVTLVDSGATGSNQVFVNENVTVATSTNHTASIFAKQDQLSWLAIGLFNFTSVSGRVWFDLSSGVVGSEDAGLTGSIQDFGNGWYRCSVTFITDSVDTSGLLSYQVCSADNTTNVDLDGTSSILIYGAQLEAGSFPTSYIPTSGATATRAADIASISVDSFGYRQDAGTVVVEQSTFNDVKNAVVWQIDDGTSNNRYVFNAFNGNTTVMDGAVSQASLTHTGQDVNVTYKNGFGYKLNSFASVYDGGGPVTDATGTLPTVSTLRFGSDTTTNAILNGHIKSIQYLPRRLSNSQLQELTA